MTDKEIRKLRKVELLEALVELSEENERLKEEIAELNKKLEERKVKLDSCGSIAEASLIIGRVFEAAQIAADCYLENVKLKIKEDSRDE